jgi:medium-chain acyl-[acyl-carrier-protein] hydrolase
MDIPEKSNRLWKQRFTLHSYEVDFRGQATAEVICRFLQEAAWNHAEILGVGFKAFERHGRFWVLSRLLVEFRRLPFWTETVEVCTWPRPSESVFAMRDFEVKDEKGLCVVAASSAWLIVDSKTKKPLRAGKILEPFGEFVNQTATGKNPEKLSLLPSHSAVKPVVATYTDVDVNRHVNASRYVGWMLNTYPLEFHSEHTLKLLEINYVGETFAGESLEILSQQNTLEQHLFSLVKTENSHEVCRAHLSWA